MSAANAAGAAGAFGASDPFDARDTPAPPWLASRAAGVLLHPSSLPGPHGSGDFGPAAYHFVDWLRGAGQRLWQWLPTTPLGPGGSPYQSDSAFAGNPLLVALEPLVGRGWLSEPGPAPGADPRRLDTGSASDWRLAQLRRAHAGFVARADGADRAALAAHGAANAGWLDDHALFMALEAAHDGRPWWSWPPALAARDPRAIAAARREHAAEIGFRRWVQWCFDVQCAALKAYANAAGIALVGDLPIFVAHHGADCWARPGQFRLDADGQPTHVAGAPPDDLGPQGQRWGNPLYRWDRMAADGFGWWRERFARLLTQADVFRIDHFRGFAAGWEIPADCPRADGGRWAPGPGRALFDAVTGALGALPIVAEDLGHITPDVHALRDALGFPGMTVLQYAFGGDARHAYLPHHARPLQLACTGTHDTDTIRGWWDGASPAVRHFAGTYLDCDADDVHWAAIRAVSNSVARLAIVPLQDVLGLPSAERMNVPGTMGPHNWSWRFDWSQVGPESARVLALIAAASGRGPFAPIGPERPPAPAASY